MKKRYLWNEEKFFYEIIPDVMYVNSRKDEVFIVEPHDSDNLEHDIAFHINEMRFIGFDIVTKYSMKIFEKKMKTLLMINKED